MNRGDRIINIKSIGFGLCVVVYFSTMIAATAEESLTASPYVDQENYRVKSLSMQEITDLRAGKGMGLSKVAELNHIPGPSHVIELADQLALTTQQRQVSHDAFDAMSREAKRLGVEIILKESALEKMFLQPSTLDAEAVHRMVSEISGLQGELRFVHLKAHMAMMQVLSPQQIIAYDRLRGYEASQGKIMNHHHN